MNPTIEAIADACLIEVKVELKMLKQQRGCLPSSKKWNSTHDQKHDQARLEHFLRIRGRNG